MLADGKVIERTYIGEQFEDIMELPNLIDVQLSSYENFLQRERLRRGEPLLNQGLERCSSPLSPLRVPAEICSLNMFTTPLMKSIFGLRWNAS